MPAVQPAELWMESGRWDQYGPLLLRMQDRHAREFCFGPTHEEVITDVARSELRSYKQLPVNYYQIQTKFRDEIRPRFGVMRSREFIMKDAYSFDIDRSGLQRILRSHARRLHGHFRTPWPEISSCGRRQWRNRRQPLAGISRACRLRGRCDRVLRRGSLCIQCRDRGDIEAERGSRGCHEELEKIPTPGVKTIEDLCELLGIAQNRQSRLSLSKARTGLSHLILRGDHELNAVKAQKLDGVASPLTMADPSTIWKATGANPGSLGPVGLAIPVYFDHAVAALSDFTCGANEDGFHYRGVNFGRDLPDPETVDLRNVVTGDPTPGGKGNAEHRARYRSRAHLPAWAPSTPRR